MPVLSLASSVASAVATLPPSFSVCPPLPCGASSCQVTSAGSDWCKKSATAGGVFSAPNTVSTAVASAVTLSVPLPDSSGFASVPNAVSLASNATPPRSSAESFENSSTPPSQVASAARFVPSSPNSTALLALSSTSPLGKVAPKLPLAAMSGSRAAIVALSSAPRLVKCTPSFSRRGCAKPISASNPWLMPETTSVPDDTVSVSLDSATSAVSEPDLPNSGLPAGGFRHSAASRSSCWLSRLTLPAKIGLSSTTLRLPLSPSVLPPARPPEKSVIVQLLVSVAAVSRTSRSAKLRRSSSVMSSPIVPLMSGIGGSGVSPSSRTSS